MFNRQIILLVALLLLPISCAPKVTSPPTAAASLSATSTSMLIATASLPPTATATATATTSPSPTPTEEPAWYQSLDPSYGKLKYQYAEVINLRARVYAGIKEAVAQSGNYGHLPEFPAYVAYTTSQAGSGHTYYYLPVFYGWIDGQDLRLLTPSPFTGILLTREISFRFGWVLEDTQSVDSEGKPRRTFQRYQVVHEFPTTATKPGYIAIGADEWLSEASVALVSPAIPKEAGKDMCRFIYGNLTSQTLEVFDQCKLVFATLISSGRNSWTFEGSFTILYKNDPYSSINPPSYSTSEYYIQAVPYFMSYAGNFGFHGAYWHDSFGTAASHGCINLSPADAHWLYDWARLGDRVIISKRE